MLCPECQEPTPLPPGGVLEALPTNFLATQSVQDAFEKGEKRSGDAVLNCAECVEEDSKVEAYCKDCLCLLCAFHVKAHRRSRDTVKHCLVKPTEKQRGKGSEDDSRSCAMLSAHAHAYTSCQLHDGQQVRSYCKNCEIFFCDRCSRLGSHKTHETVSVEDASLAAKTETEMINARVRERSLPAIERQIACVRVQAETINTSADSSKTEVQNACDRMRAAIDKRERELLGKIEEERRKALTPLEAEERSLNQAMISSQQAVAITTQCLDTLEGCQLVDVSKVTNRQLRAFEKEAVRLKMPLAFTSIIHSLSSSDLLRQDMQSLRTFGDVSSTTETLSALSPRRSSLTIEDTSPSSQISFEYKIQLQLVDVDGECADSRLLAMQPVQYNYIELMSPAQTKAAANHAGPTSEKLVFEKEQYGGLACSFRSPVPGVYKISAEIDGEPLPGSPQILDCGITKLPFRFDSSSSGADAVLNEDLSLVTCQESADAISILGRYSFSTGQHAWRVRVTGSETKIQGEAVKIGLYAGPDDVQYDIDSICVVRGDGTNRLGANAKPSNLPCWEADDVISLCFDMAYEEYDDDNDRTYNGLCRWTHERTGKSYEIMGVADFGPVRPYFRLQPSVSMEILPRQSSSHLAD